MKVFISWAEERSRTVAEALRDWLGDVLQNVEPWVSFNDVEKGARWANEISIQLRESQFGLICLTPEAQQSHWLLFEAGALSKLDQARVWTYLVGLGKDAVVGPLKQFQHTDATEADTRKLLKTINSHQGEKKLEDARLERLFAKHWPDLKKVLDNLPVGNGAKPAPPSAESLVPELFEYVRALSDEVRKLPEAIARLGDEWRSRAPNVRQLPTFRAVILAESVGNIEKLIARRLLAAGTVIDVRTTGKPDGSFVYEVDLLTPLEPTELIFLIKSIEAIDGVSWARLDKFDLG